jgi:hypothetical protein
MAAFMHRLSDYVLTEAGGRTAAYSTFHDDNVGVTGTLATVTSLSVPAGSYVVNSKFWTTNAGTATTNTTCVLSAGAECDEVTYSSTGFGDFDNDKFRAGALQLVHTFDAAARST